MNSLYPWHQKQWQYLAGSKNQNRLSHALLLTGMEGMGQVEFAKTFAELLLCHKPHEFGCGECRSCRLLKISSHPDLLYVQPEAPSKIIKIEQIRELNDALHKTSHDGGYQIAIIEPAETMNAAAANALLKTLEEPFGKVILFLICYQSSYLPATIRSRCQSIIFDTKDKAAIEAWLKQQVQPDENIKSLLTLVEYSPLKALVLLDQQKENKIIFDDFFQLITGKIMPVKLGEKWKSLDINRILELLQTLITDLIRLKSKLSDKFILHQDKLPLLQSLQNQFSLEKLFGLFNLILEKNRLLKKNINLNTQLMLEDILIRIVRGIAF